MRLSSQGEVQENGYSTVSKGLRKRPGSKHLKQLSTSSFGDAFTHIINRDTTEQYVVVVTSENLRVFDMAGVERTVSFPNGKTYLTSATPSKDFRAVTVADYTFFVNRAITVAEDSTPVYAVRPYEAIINVKQGNYGKSYVVAINGTTKATFTTNNGGTATDVTTISTDYIATQLTTQLTTALTGWTVTRSGSVIYLSSATDFTVTADDGFSNYAMSAIKGRVQKFSDLPARCPVDGFSVEVLGDSGSAQSSYYIRYDASSTSGGVWKETSKPGIPGGLLATTMPMGLVRNSDGTFTLQSLTWAKRKAGDATSNPHPSFFGRKLNDVFFYRNRLGFLSDENVVMSEVGEYFNVYRTTMMQLLDSDVIDVTATHTKVCILEHALQFNKQLLLFSEQAQFMIDQADILSPSSVSVKLTTEFPTNVRTKPSGIGRSVYYTVDKGNWAAVQEYFTDTNNAGLQDATEVTGHVPKYIPAGTFKIATSLNENTACFLTTGERSSIFVYKYLWANSEKVQSSWSKWTLGAGVQVLNAEFLQSTLVLLLQRNDGVYLETMDLALGAQDSYEAYQTLLDRRRFIAKEGLTYSNGITRFTDSVSLGTGETVVAVTAVGGTKNAGLVLDVKRDGIGPYVEKDVTGTDLIVGAQYTFKYTFSTIVVKQQTGNGQKSDTEGRLQIRKVALNYADTGFFKVNVTPASRTGYTYAYTGKVLGGVSATLGAVILDTGRFTVPVMSQNTAATITVVNDSPVPCALLSVDWEGFYVKRSQPL